MHNINNSQQPDCKHCIYVLRLFAIKLFEMLRFCEHYSHIQLLIWLLVYRQLAKITMVDVVKGQSMQICNINDYHMSPSLIVL